MAINFQSQDITFKPAKPIAIKTWIKRIISLEKKTEGALNFVFVNDETLLQKNKQFLNHDTYTDIITFDYSEGKKISGDILISVDRIRENSAKFDTEFDNELRRVMIHGILHLCGYSDKNKAAKELMRKKEDWALKKF